MSQTGRTRGPVPLGFLGLVAIVAVVEAVVGAHDLDFTNEPATDWALSARAAEGEARGAELLCFGDSLVKFGLVPEVLERGTGMRTFNLSILGGQAATSYFLLRRAIDDGARPRAILLDCQDLPGVERQDKRGLGLPLRRREWPELLRTRDTIELAWSARDAGFLAAVTLARLFPTIKARDEIRLNGTRAYRSRGSDARFLAKVQRRNWEVNRGGMLLAPKPESRTRITPALATASPTPWTVDPVSLEYLRKFLATATALGIPVFWVLPPTSPEHQALRARVGQREHYTNLAMALRAEFPTLTVVDGRGSRFARPRFVDDTHLDRVGAVAFSVALADAIARTLSDGDDAPRWVDLPPYREPPDGGRFEDLDGSRLAVDPKRRARR